MVRWQSDASITLAERKALADTLSNYINDWAQYMIGYENWVYKKIEVNVVAWLWPTKPCCKTCKVMRLSYTDYTTDDLHSSNSAIPENCPAPLLNTAGLNTSLRVITTTATASLICMHGAPTDGPLAVLAVIGDNGLHTASG